MKVSVIGDARRLAEWSAESRRLGEQLAAAVGPTHRSMEKLTAALEPQRRMAAAAAEAMAPMQELARGIRASIGPSIDVSRIVGPTIKDMAATLSSSAVVDAARSMQPFQEQARQLQESFADHLRFATSVQETFARVMPTVGDLIGDTLREQLAGLDDLLGPVLDDLEVDDEPVAAAVEVAPSEVERIVHRSITDFVPMLLFVATMVAWLRYATVAVSPDADLADVIGALATALALTATYVKHARDQ